MTTILNLPDELLIMICEKINSVVDLVSFSLCSKRMNFISKSSELNQYDVYDIKLKENINKAFEFNKNIKLKFKLYSKYEIHDFNIVSNIYDLDISYSVISDVSMLSRVHILDLSCCYNISDVSMLGNVYDLELSWCKISDVSNLGNVHKLKLSGCTSITDVSNLGNVHDLNLSFCYISDVSNLGNVNILKLRWCKNIQDVSKLGRVHDLNLSYCNGVKDISMLKNVHTLNIQGCKAHIY